MLPRCLQLTTLIDVLYLCRGSHNSFGVPVDPASYMDSDDQQVDIPYLDEYANTSWETILHYLVGSSLASKPSDAVLLILKTSGLMTGSGTAGRNLKITSKGFQFLLEDVNTQLWNLLLRYLAAAEEQDMDLVEVLAFLFMLGSLELGRVGVNIIEAPKAMPPPYLLMWHLCFRRIPLLT